MLVLSSRNNSKITPAIIPMWEFKGFQYASAIDLTTLLYKTRLFIYKAHFFFFFAAFGVTKHRTCTDLRKMLFIGILKSKEGLRNTLNSELLKTLLKNMNRVHTINPSSKCDPYV